MKKIKVLLLAADPYSTNSSDFDEQVRIIRNQFCHLTNIEFASEWAVSVNEVNDALDFHCPRVVHFISFTSREGIVLPMQAGGRPARDKVFRFHLSGLSWRICLIVLDGCYPPEQPRDLATVSGCVISINDSTDASNTLGFVTALYNHISGGCSILDAFDRSKSTALSSTRYNQQGKKPTVILLPPTVDPQGNIPTLPGLSQLFKRRKVFIGYYKSEEDDKWLKELQTHLMSLKCEGVTEPWDIAKTPIDAESKQRLQTAIETSKSVVLLVSPGFVASICTVNVHLPPLLSKVQGGTTVRLVIASHCRWFRLQELKDFECFNPKKSLAKMRRSELDEALVQLTEMVDGDLKDVES